MGGMPKWGAVDLIASSLVSGAKNGFKKWVMMATMYVSETITPRLLDVSVLDGGFGR